MPQNTSLGSKEMTDLSLRPRTEAFLRRWKAMVRDRPRGTGYDLTASRQVAFLERVDAFVQDPAAETFDAIWTEDVAVEHANPGGPLLRSAFDGDIDELATFVETLRTADTYDPGWEDRLQWQYALWECYTRTNHAVPVIVTSESLDALAWLGEQPNGSFADRLATMKQFASCYSKVVGHATADTAHGVDPKTELDVLFRLIETVDSDDIVSELDGPHAEFYRVLYGGSSMAGGRSGPVRLTDIGPVVRAYARGVENGAYEEPSRPEYWGGTHWETWKDSYATHVENEVRGRFVLDDLSPGEIEPLFDILTTTDGAELSKPVVTYLMGSQWGQYTWNDVVDHFRNNPAEASRMLSMFFDESAHVVDRLSAFRQHTIHITESEGRNPGSIERMATSLLMFAFPDEHVGLPPARTKTFLEAYTTLPKYKSGFRPRQYWTVIVPLRSLRDELQYALDQREEEYTVTMLDIHSLIWIYGSKGSPEPRHLPDDEPDHMQNA